MSSIKQETIHGLKWSTVDKFGNFGISFIVGVFLARLLDPSDFGLLAMVSIFFAISNIFIDGGFGQALVQKKEVTEEDRSTMFYFNMGMSIFFYLLLFFAAPYIADFLGYSVLKSIIRISGIPMLIGPLGSNQNNLLVRAINFKIPALISITKNIVSGAIGIWMAYNGFGVWALVWSSLISSVMGTVIICIIVPWLPKTGFSTSSFKAMFSFGGNLTLNSLLDKIYEQGSSLLIGKYYTPTDLGYFNKGQSTASLPSTFLANIVSGVAFPVMSKVQENDETLLHVYRRFMRSLSLVIFFGMFLLVALAKPLVLFLYSAKWLPAVPYIQIIAFDYMLYHVNLVNWDLLLVKGRTDISLKKELINKIWKFGFMALTLPIGTIAFALGTVASSIMNVIVNTLVTGHFYHYGFKMQVSDFMPHMIKGVIVCIPAYLITLLDIHPLISVC